MVLDPADPEFAARVRDSFARQRFMSHLGAALVVIEPGYCEIHLPYRDELTQQHRYFHAGATAAVIDSACGYAAFSLMPADASVLTVEYKINLLAPAQGHMVVAKGRVIRNGRTLKVCRGEGFGVMEGRQTQCAEALSTIMTLPGRPDR